MTLQFDYIVFLLLTIVRFFISSVYYSSLLFGDIYFKELKISHSDFEQKKKDGKLPGLFLKQFVIASFAMFLHYQLLIWYGQDLQRSLYFTLLLYIGFAIPTFFQGVLWEGKSLRLFSINAGFQLISTVFLTTFVFMFTEHIQNK